MERVGRIVNVSLLGDCILLCCVVVNIIRLVLLWVKRAPEITDCIPLYKPVERPHGTRVTLTGKSAIKEIIDSKAFYADFGNSFEAIQVILSSTLRLVSKVLLLRQLPRFLPDVVVLAAFKSELSLSLLILADQGLLCIIHAQTFHSYTLAT